MAINKQFKVPVNLLNAPTDPVTGHEGDIYYNTTTNVIRLYKNGAWEDILASSTVEGSPGYYGAFHDTTTQNIVSTTTAYKITMNSTDESNGISRDVADTSKIRFAHAGTYSLTFSIQLINTSNSIKNANVWFRKGSGSGSSSDIPYSNSQTTVPNSHGGLPGQSILTVNLVATFAANDYVQLYWQGESTELSIETIAAGTIPTTPVTPSIIFTAVQVASVLTGGGGSGASVLDDLTDVVQTDPADNEVLAYNAANDTWINQTASEAGLATSDHNHSGEYQPLDSNLTDISDLDWIANQAGPYYNGVIGVVPTGTELDLLNDIRIETLGIVSDNTDNIKGSLYTDGFGLIIDAYSDITLTTSTGGQYLNSIDPDNQIATAGDISALSTVYQPLDTDLTNIALLTGTSGFLKTDGENGWTVDTTVYATSTDIGDAVGDYIPLTQKGDPQGVAELDIDGLVPVAQLPDLSDTYLTVSTASSTYATQSSLSSYLTTSSASSTYLTQSDASSTYLTQSNASSTYLTQSNASSTYLTSSTASSTYQPKDQDLTDIAALTGNGILKKTAGVWGMDASAYLTSFTETDPVFTAHDAYNVTSAKITNWDTAYTDRNKWDGGSTGLNAATGRTSLGLGTMATASASDYAALSGATFTGDIAVNGGDITTTATTATLYNANATTVNIGSAATTVSIGDTANHTGTTTVQHDLYVAGNITFGGTSTTLSATNLDVTDSLIYLSVNNTADILDIGWVGAYKPASTHLHTGFVRDASDGKWKLFSGISAEPTTVVDFTSATYDTLKIGALEVTDASTTRTNLGLAIGTNVQAYSATLAGINTLGSGTGFLKNTAGTWSYDNSTYLTTSSAASTYLTTSSASSTYAALSGASFTGDVSSTGNISAGGVLKSTASSTNEGGQIELTLPSSGSTLSGTNVTIDVYQDKLRIFESGGTNRGVYIPLTSAGATVGTSLLGGTTGAMNYAQTQASKQSTISSAGTVLVSASLTTNGYPIQVIATGDMENNSAGGWIRLQLYRDSTAIGKIIHAESSAGSENVPFALNVIDTPSAGTYTYSLKLVSSAGGTFNFGETDGPVITAVELSGPKGDTGATGSAPFTNSAGLASNLSDETGFSTGAKAVFSISPEISTSITTASTTFNLLNTTATTLNIGGAATTLSIGASTGTTTVNNNLALSGAVSIAASKNIAVASYYSSTFGTGRVIMTGTGSNPTTRPDGTSLVAGDIWISY